MLARLGRFFRKRIRRRPFAALQVEPTSRCQLRCVMCPRTAFSEEWDAGDMPLSVYKAIGEAFHLVDDVHLQGWGEPLLHPQLLDMVEMAKSAECRVSLTTNGVLLTSHISERLIGAGVDIIAVSMAGASKETHESIRRGSYFEHLVNNLQKVSELKERMRSKTPKLVLSYIMTTKNIDELPAAIDLAKELGIDEMVATNLDYTPTSTQDGLKVFSSHRPAIRFKELIEAARARAARSRLLLRVYPLRLEEAIMCEMNPLQIVSISHDGCVSPCVYRNMTKQGLIPGIFCGAPYAVQRLCFGRIPENPFLGIWESENYAEFRTAYSRRMSLLEKGSAILNFESTDIEKVKREITQGLAENPLPDVCKTCYKAYGV